MKTLLNKRFSLCFTTHEIESANVLRDFQRSLHHKRQLLSIGCCNQQKAYLAYLNTILSVYHDEKVLPFP
ncbi:hypothetical protein M3Y96_01029900 [Aphelenchoides besseyi]|nr:hypothetical protein M3Y96_01029900 [Aphelenchoides besseyi]